jgi:tetraacyldisaccharide-1-P 4'-kinase
MTEKDAVKCTALAPEAWALRVEAKLPAAWEAQWLASVRDLIREYEVDK